jgi:hypothetical protein
MAHKGVFHMEDRQIALLSEQMSHALDLLRADLDGLQVRLAHQDDMSSHRLSLLEDTAADHEERLRTVSDGVTQFKMWTGLVSGSAGLAALTALLKSFLGGY